MIKGFYVLTEILLNNEKDIEDELDLFEEEDNYHIPTFRIDD